MVRSPWILSVVTVFGCQDVSFSSAPPPAEVPDGESIAPEVVTDKLLQAVSPVTDVLFVIDNSCSMGDNQDNLSRNAPSFMEWFVGSGLDYHIGVVSTDMVDTDDQGKLQEIDGLRWLTDEVPDPVDAFSRLAVLGNRGASPERGIDGLYNAIETEGNEHNRGFLRDGAFHAIFVSDEDDFSLDISADEFVRWFDGLRSPSESTCSAIQNPNCGASGCGYKYGTAAEQLRGVVWNIDADGWDEVLERLGILTTGRRAEYFLTQLPYVESIVVEVNVPRNDGGSTLVRPPRAEFDDEGRLVSAGWSYVGDRNSVLFHDYVPPDYATISITYTTVDGYPVVEDEGEDDPTP